jgi:serine/threonine protein kinase
VKTENMLLTPQRNLKIADFGVARVEAQNPKDMTGATGTLGYMAPEVLTGLAFLICLFHNVSFSYSHANFFLFFVCLTGS